MIIDCISDLHGSKPFLPGGDLLIIAGDITARDTVQQWVEFFAWLKEKNYRKKVIVGGNHDKFLQMTASSKDAEDMGFRVDYDYEYLLDSGTEFEGLKIWGSPWTNWFEGVNPECDAFMLRHEEELSDKWAMIPTDVDILVTHSPPHGTLDYVIEDGHPESKGSLSLHYRLFDINPRLHVFGHIHESHGMYRPNLQMSEDLNLLGYPIFVNASIMNRYYQPYNKPIRIEL